MHGKDSSMMTGFQFLHFKNYFLHGLSLLLRDDAEEVTCNDLFVNQFILLNENYSNHNDQSFQAGHEDGRKINSRHKIYTVFTKFQKYLNTQKTSIRSELVPVKTEKRNDDKMKEYHFNKFLHLAYSDQYDWLSWWSFSIQTRRDYSYYFSWPD